MAYDRGIGRAETARPPKMKGEKLDSQKVESRDNRVRQQSKRKYLAGGDNSGKLNSAYQALEFAGQDVDWASENLYQNTSGLDAEGKGLVGEQLSTWDETSKWNWEQYCQQKGILGTTKKKIDQAIQDYKTVWGNYGQRQQEWKQLSDQHIQTGSLDFGGFLPEVQKEIYEKKQQGNHMRLEMLEGVETPEGQKKLLKEKQAYLDTRKEEILAEYSEIQNYLLMEEELEYTDPEFIRLMGGAKGAYESNEIKDQQTKAWLARFQELEEELREYPDAEELLDFESLEKEKKYIEDTNYYDSLIFEDDWEKFAYYATTANGKKFEYKGGYFPDGGKYASFAWPYILETGFEDLEYDYVNRDPEAINVMKVYDTAYDRFVTGIDDTPLEQMTEGEIDRYNYLYHKFDKEEAENYLEYLRPELNRRNRTAEEWNARKAAQADPVGSSLDSIAKTALKPVSYFGQFMNYLEKGEIDQNARYNQYVYIPAAIREEVGQEVERSWGKVGSAAYQIGMGFADYLVALGLSVGKKGIALAIMSTSAAADAVVEAKDRGVEDDAAFALGCVTGLIELASEKISLDTLFDCSNMEKGAAEYVLKNALVGGGDEVSSEVLGFTADVLISQDKSEWNLSIQRYMAEEGLSEGEAIRKAIGDQAMNLVGTFTAGALSQGGVSMLPVAADYFQRKVADWNTKNKLTDAILAGSAELPKPEGMSDSDWQAATLQAAGEETALGKSGRIYSVEPHYIENAGRVAQEMGIEAVFDDTVPLEKKAVYDPVNGVMHLSTKYFGTGNYETIFNEALEEMESWNTSRIGADDVYKRPLGVEAGEWETRKLAAIAEVEAEGKAKEGAHTEISGILYGVTPKVQKKVKNYSEWAGLDIVFDGTLEEGALGTVDAKTGMIRLNANLGEADVKSSLIQVLTDELEHRLDVRYAKEGGFKFLPMDSKRMEWYTEKTEAKVKERLSSGAGPLTRGSYIKLGKDGQPIQNGRPQLSNAQDKLLFEQIVYLSCVDEDGVLTDANNKEIVLDWKPGQSRQGVVDFGHKRGYEYDKLFQAYVEGVFPLDELKNIAFNPAIYQLEAPGPNRSHAHEQK